MGYTARKHTLMKPSQNNNRDFHERRFFTLDNDSHKDAGTAADLQKVDYIYDLPFSQFDDPLKVIEFYLRVCTDLGADIGSFVLIDHRYHHKRDGSLEDIPFTQTAFVYYSDRCDVQKWRNGKPIYRWVDGVLYTDRNSQTLARSLTPPTGVMSLTYYLIENSTGLFELLALNERGTPLYYQSNWCMPVEVLLKDILYMETNNGKIPRFPKPSPPSLDSLSSQGKQVILSGKVGSRVRTWHHDLLSPLSKKLFLPEYPLRTALDMISADPSLESKWIVKDVAICTNNFIDRDDLVDYATSRISIFCSSTTWKDEKEGTHYSLWDMIRSGRFRKGISPMALASIWDGSPEITPDTVIGHAFWLSSPLENTPLPTDPERTGTPEELYPYVIKDRPEGEAKTLYGDTAIVGDVWFVSANNHWTPVYQSDLHPSIASLVKSAAGEARNHHLSIRVDTKYLHWSDFKGDYAADAVRASKLVPNSDWLGVHGINAISAD